MFGFFKKGGVLKDKPKNQMKLPESFYFVGEPELSAGEVFYPVIVRSHYWGLSHLDYERVIASDDKIYKYYHSRESAETEAEQKNKEIKDSLPPIGQDEGDSTTRTFG